MTQQALQQVTLIKPHTHAGVKAAAGGVISVPATDAAWLRQHGIAEDERKPSALLPSPVSPASRTTHQKSLGVTHE